MADSPTAEMIAICHSSNPLKLLDLSVGPWLPGTLLGNGDGLLTIEGVMIAYMVLSIAKGGVILELSLVVEDDAMAEDGVMIEALKR